MTQFLRASGFAAAALFVGFACSGPSSSTPSTGGGSDQEGDVGEVSMSLDVTSGVTLSSATFNISGPGAFSRAGNIDLSHSATLSFLVGGLPGGTGYTVTVTSVSADGATTCVGSATFSVTARTTSTVSLHLTCREPLRTGSAQINGVINVCPVVDGVTALPAQAFVGTGIRLSGAAHDSDSGPVALAYTWTATSGVFDNANSPTPLFTCAVPGPSTITLTVADGDSNPTCPDNLSVTVSCDPPPPRPYAYVVLGSNGAPIARVITPDATCPSITLDGVAQPMSLRVAAGTIPVRTSSASPVKASAFPVTTCETTIPSTVTRAEVLGRALALPKANPTKIVIIGDTGCRLKTGNPWQACSDTTQWPFSVIADVAAAQHPDLVLHVGDYHYRENACPANVTGCQGSPWSYGWDAWEADLFRPAQNLLQAAPWIVVRGNHEECLRGGQGWFRFLDTLSYAESRSCNDPANDTIANYNDPYAVPVGADTQVIVFDTSKAGANALNPAVAADAPIFATYQAELQKAAALASNPAVFSIFANHHPLLGYAPVAMGNPAGGQGSLLSVMSATYPDTYYPPNIGLAMHGHVHLFEAISFQTPNPPTFVAGMGGDNLDSALPDPFPFSVSPAAGVVPNMIAHDNAYGFMTMERVSGSWVYKAYKIDGTVIATCSVIASDKLSCTPQGYLH